MARKTQDNPQLDMTPMIDVVFELIIFFVVTIKQEDIFSKLNCNRPAPQPPNVTDKQEEEISVNIEIGRRYDGSPQGVILYNKREVKRTELDQHLRDIARTKKTTPIIVKCEDRSPHKALVDVLDICYKNELYSVSVFSM
jgi:biopolymer transport protein ExbD